MDDLKMHNQDQGSRLGKRPGSGGASEDKTTGTVHIHEFFDNSEDALCMQADREPDFNREELASLLFNARTEIMTLRSAVNGLKPKAEAYDMLRTVLLGSEVERFGIGIDMVPYMTRMAERLLNPPKSAMKGAQSDIAKNITE